MRRMSLLFVTFLAGCGVRVEPPALPNADNSDVPGIGGGLVTMSEYGIWAAGICLLLSVIVFIWGPKKYGALLAVTAVGVAIASQVLAILGDNLLWLSIVAGLAFLVVGGRYVWVKYGEDIDDALGIDIHDSGTDKIPLAKADTVALERIERKDGK